MNETMVAAWLTACCVSISLAVVFIMIASTARRYLDLKKEELSIRMKEANRIIPPDHTKNLQYSKDLLNFIQGIVAQESVMFFKEFVDGHHMERVTLSQIKKMINGIANRVNDAINRDTIDFSMTIFNEHFFDWYIIDNSKKYVKELLEKYVIDIVDEGE